jgi:hypothetical protein
MPVDIVRINSGAFDDVKNSRHTKAIRHLVNGSEQQPWIKALLPSEIHLQERIRALKTQKTGERSDEISYIHSRIKQIENVFGEEAERLKESRKILENDPKILELRELHAAAEVRLKEFEEVWRWFTSNYEYTERHLSRDVKRLDSFSRMRWKMLSKESKDAASFYVSINWMQNLHKKTKTITEPYMERKAYVMREMAIPYINSTEERSYGGFCKFVERRLAELREIAENARLKELIAQRRIFELDAYLDDLEKRRDSFIAFENKRIGKVMTEIDTDVEKELRPLIASVLLRHEAVNKSVSKLPGWAGQDWKVKRRRDIKLEPDIKTLFKIGNDTKLR